MRFWTAGTLKMHQPQKLRHTIAINCAPFRTSPDSAENMGCGVQKHGVHNQ